MDHGKGSYKIIVSGIVQGVGFRPLTFRIALKHGIRGTVRNIGGKVEILAYAGEEELFEFLNELRNSESTGCEITNMEITEQSSEENIIYNDFRIIESGSDISELSQEIKAQLLSIPVLDVVINEQRSPLMIAVGQTTASLYKCFSGEIRKIKYPSFN